MTAMDVGGSLIYRAQGGEKGNKFTNVANEWDSMRNPNVAKNCGPVFKNMTPQELVDSAKKVALVPQDVIESLTSKYSQSGAQALYHKISTRQGDIMKRAQEIEISLIGKKEVTVTAELKVTPEVKVETKPVSTGDLKVGDIVAWTTGHDDWDNAYTVTEINSDENKKVLLQEVKTG